MNKGNTNKGKVVYIGASAFFAAANGVSSEEGLTGIGALHAKLQKELEADRIAEIRALEGLQRTLEHEEPQAGQRWEQMKLRYTQDPPTVIGPAAILVAATFMVCIEANLLAPTLDILGVSNPLWQFLSAFGLPIASAIVFHLALEAKEKHHPSFRSKAGWALALLAGLIGFGFWRAKALAFEASHSGSAISGFLMSNPTATLLAIGALTVLIPVAAAYAAHHGMGTLSQWWEFGRARKNAAQKKAALDAATKQTESAKEKLAHDLDAIQRQNEEWQAEYKHYWDLGHQNGAKKGPMWLVWAKSASVLLGCLMVITLGLSWLNIPYALSWGVVAGIVSGLAAFVHFYRQREHPTPEQFLRRANVRFTDYPARSSTQLRTVVPEESRPKVFLTEPREKVH